MSDNITLLLSMDLYIWTFFFALLGLVFGSFANVIILRLPQDKSIISPGSHCLKCEQPIQWYDNIPLLSFLFLKGKCRQCSQRISWRYPFIELLTAFVFSYAFIATGWDWILLEYLILFFGLIVVSFIDFDHQIIPDEFSLSGIVIGLIGATVNPERSFNDASLGVLLGGGFLWTISYFYTAIRKQEGLGGGDIKLLAWIGSVLGWKSVPFIIISSSLLGSIVGVIIAMKSQKGLKAAIPFGPYLALAALLYVFWGEKLAVWYIQLFIPSIMN